MSRIVKPAPFLYAIRNKKTKELLNKKSNSANPYYVAMKVATKKMDERVEEIVTYKLTEINT